MPILAEKEAEYAELFANPYTAAQRGFIDEVILPRDTRRKLIKAFSGLDVYIYLKSEDCQWYRKDYHGTESIHWQEVCKHPWMTMTIKSNGEVAMCMEDFNNEIVFGCVDRG